MSSFNNVVKVLYKDNQDMIVSLLEYILFEDAKLAEKYLVFKFSNNLNQTLTKIKFEVQEFDKEGDLIEKAILEYDGFEAKEGASFVPNAKLGVNFECKSIKVKLLYAGFERIAWNEGKYEQIEYTLDDFRSDFKPTEKDEKINPKELKKKNKNEAKLRKMAEKIRLREEKKLNKEKRFISKEFINSNKTGAAFKATFLMVIAFVIFLGVSIFYFNKENRQFYENGFTYEVTSEGATVVDYDDLNCDVTIPLKAGDYDVIAVGDKAFKNSKVNTIHISSSIVIGDNAFNGAHNLSKVDGAQFISKIGDYSFKDCYQLIEMELSNAFYIGKGAFEGCYNLKEVIAKAATVDMNAFSNCENIISLDIREVAANNKLNSLFGSVVPKSFSKLNIGAQRFVSGFFDDMENVSVKMTNEDEALFEYGALAGLNLKYNYKITPSLEIYKDRIIAVNKENDSFVIPSNLTHIEDLKSFDLSFVKTLRVESQLKPVGYETMRLFTHLEVLEYSPRVDFLEDAFSYNTLLTKLVLDSNDYYTNGIDVCLDYVNELEIKGNGRITKKMLMNNTFNFDNISSLRVESNNIELNAFSNLTRLKEIEIPTLYYSLDKYGINKSIYEIYLTKSDITTLDSYYINGYTSLTTLELPSNITKIGSYFLTNVPLESLILPDDLIVIENNFISYCYRLREVKIPSGVTTIGSYFISDCPNITNVSFPSGLESIGSYILNNTGVYSLKLPNGIKNIGRPILDFNSNINNVEIPFIKGSYKDFNLDYRNTTSLTITEDITLSYNTLTDLPNLNTLIFKGKVRGLSSNIFKGNTNIKILEIEADFNTSLASLFGENSISLDTLIISSNELGKSFFNGCDIRKLAIKKADKLDVDLFKGVKKIKSIFITAHTQINVIDYQTLESKCETVVTDTKFSDHVKKKMADIRIKCREGLSLEDFLNYY